MWKAPFRPNTTVSQSFNDGILTVYAVSDTAEPGRKPEENLTKKVVLRYEEQRLGLQRYYAGRQNQVQIERVVRTPRHGGVSSQDVAITEDGRQYRIDLVQSVPNVWPESVDLTLARIDQKFEVSGDGMV